MCKRHVNNYKRTKAEYVVENYCTVKILNLYSMYSKKNVLPSLSAFKGIRSK